MSCIEQNLQKCTCTYPGCPRKGACCQCIAYHRERGELTACVFPAEAEKTWDRSIAAFIKAHS